MSPVEKAFLFGCFVGAGGFGLLLAIAVSVVEACVLRGEQ